MISIEMEGSRFNYRVAGILIIQDRILLEKDSIYGFWVLPGGRCEINEESAVTVCREFHEELDYKIRTLNLVSLNENFFEYDGEKFHEIGLYYECELLDDVDPEQFENEFNGLEESHIYKWWEIDELETIQFYPLEVKTMILKQEIGKFLHFVTRED